jgi:two-component system, cell cycle sensor histidine kinase and response regulator CckA
MPRSVNRTWLNFVWLFFLILLGLWLPPSPAGAAKVVRVGIYDNKPLVFRDIGGQPRGIFVDLLAAYAMRADVHLVYVYGSFSEGLERLENGGIDMMTAIGFSQERAKRFDYTLETVLNNWGEIYSTKDRKIESILDLEGKRIGVNHGDIHLEALRRLTGEFGIHCRFIEGDSYDMVFEMLAADFVPLGLVNHLYGRENQAPYGVSSTPVVFNPIEIKFAVLKGRQENLLHSLDAELARLKNKQGSAYYRSLERWMMASPGEKTLPAWIIYLGLLCLLSLLTLIGGNLILRHRVGMRTRELSEANTRLEAQIQVSRMAEEELRKSVKVVAASSDAMALLDLTGVLQTVNPIYLKMLGKDREAVIGHRLEALYPSDFLEETLMPRVNGCLEGQMVRFRSAWPHAGQDDIQAEVTCSPYFNQDGQLSGVVLNIRDITETQKLAAQLKQAQKMEAIGTLAGGVAHDLNNILSGLVGYPDILLMDLPPDSPHRRPVTVIKNSGERAAAIVQDMLTLARRSVDQREPVELNTIIGDFLASPENAQIQQLHPEVAYQVDLSAQALIVSGSKVHLAKTIMNLVANAAEAMPDGGVLHLTTRFESRLETPLTPTKPSESGYAVVEVSDTGIGIAPEDRERIFEPFYTRKVMGRSGTGLGMAVVWGTVTDHDGQIQVESRVGEGTRFIVQLPLSDDAAPALHPRIKDLPTGGGERILVVDDEEAQRLLAKELLSRLGYRVSLASNSNAALDLLGAQRFDLVILDMIMPGGMDGLDTYQAIRAVRPDQKAIIVSGFSESERVRAAQLLGAGTYLRKPYTVEDLAVTLRAALDEAPHPRVP